MNWRKWCDEFVLAGKGILLATRERHFWYGFVPSFLFFGLLMNLLSGGTAKFEMIGILGLPGGLKIIWENLIAIFGVGQPFLDWLPIFIISILQGILIGIIVLLAKKKSKSPKQGTKTRTKSQKPNTSSKTEQTKSAENIENIGSASLITGLIALGAGCPTCGVTLLTPLLGAIFSTGGLAIAGTISSIVTILAVIIAILSLKRLGVEVYVIIVNEQYLKRRKKNE